MNHSVPNPRSSERHHGVMAAEPMLLIDQDTVPPGVANRANKERGVDGKPSAKERPALTGGLTKPVLYQRFAAIRAGRHRSNRLPIDRSEEHTSELQSLMRTSYAVFCWKKNN